MQKLPARAAVCMLHLLESTQHSTHFIDEASNLSADRAPDTLLPWSNSLRRRAGLCGLVALLTVPLTLCCPGQTHCVTVQGPVGRRPCPPGLPEGQPQRDRANVRRGHRYREWSLHARPGWAPDSRSESRQHARVTGLPVSAQGLSPFPWILHCNAFMFAKHEGVFRGPALCNPPHLLGYGAILPSPPNQRSRHSHRTLCDLHHGV